MAKVLLINPHGAGVVFAASGYLAPALERAGHVVEVLDCALEALAPDTERFREALTALAPDVVGLTYWTINRPRIEATLATVRAVLPGSRIVVGGPHPSVVGTEVLDHAGIDFAVRGEGEFALPRLVDALEQGRESFPDIPNLVWRDQGRPVANPVEYIEDLDALGLPDFGRMDLGAHIAAGYDYGAPKGRRAAPIYATRGCPYACAFCSTPLCMGRAVRMHSPDYVLAVLDRLYQDHGVRHFTLLDDNFTFHRDYVLAVCERIRAWNKPDISFHAPQGVRVERLDREVLAAMRDVGWDTIVIAPESGCPETLRRMRKKLRLDKVVEQVQVIREVGLSVIGFFIIGYPGETEADIRTTFAFAERCDFDAVFFNKFQPLPGTPVFKELVAAGEIPPDYLPTNYHGAQHYAPRGLDPRRLHWLHNWATYRYHLSSWRRLRYVLRTKGIVKPLRIMLRDHQVLGSLVNLARGGRNAARS